MNKDARSEMDATASVTEQASQWWQLLNSGPATPADHQAFGEWVARSPERVEAFLQTARLTKALRSKTLRWPDTPVEVLARAAREGAGVVHLNDSSTPAVSASRGATRRRSMWLATSATCIVTLAAGAGVLLTRAQHYETAIGEQRSVVLTDGTLVTLNTASRVEVRYAKSVRSIRLVAGEALFQVAQDPGRPFDVEAGTTTVRALGTEFNVDTRPGRTTVTVVEGKVAVIERAADQLAATLSAGEQLTVAANVKAASAPKHADVATATAWIQRRLVFERRSLGEVAAEFNRYNRRAIRIESEALRTQEVTGVFQANDPESFLDFIAHIPGARLERDADAIRVY